MKLRHKPSKKVLEVDTELGKRLLARSEGSYELIEEEPKVKAKKKHENTKSEQGSSDSK